MNTPTDGFGSSAIDALRAQAASALAAAAPAVLVHADGTLLAANPAGRAALDERLAASLGARLAPGLRPGRPARLERVRLPGRLTPATFACSLLVSGPARAVLLVALDIAPVTAADAAPTAPATAEAASAAAPASLRFTWRTGLDARLSAIDPRLAAALGRAPEEIAGLDWRALGAHGVHRAVLEGLSFNHLPALLPTAQGDLLDVELGGAPIRGEGLRGFGIVKGRRALPAGSSPEPAAPPAPPRAPYAEAQPATPAPDSSPVRVTLSIVPSSPNVVPLRAGHGAGNGTGAGEAPRADGVRASWEGLSTGERNAFREIARALGARLEGVDDFPAPPEAAPAEPESFAAESFAPEPSAPQPSAPEPAAETPPPAAPVAPAPAAGPEGLHRVLAEGERPVLDRLPLGLVAFRGDRLLYANRALLDWTGYADLSVMESAGGLAALFDSGTDDDADGRTLTIFDAAGAPIAVEARLMSAPWDGGTAMLYVLHRTSGAAEARQRESLRAAELALREAESSGRELRAILDTATDGVVLLDAAGTILGMNHPAEALFGFNASDVQGEAFTLLLAPESHRPAVDYLDGLASNGVASVLNDGREVIGRVREGGLIPLFMTMGRVGDDPTKFCAVLRDITQWKRAEEELIEAKRLAERANLAKSDFLAKISHEIRTPLNAIIGFSEVMMEERFGAIENQRYRDYLRDIHASGEHLISLINDLLDLSKIEAGKLDLAFTSVPLNEIVQQCMGIMQPQANRERIIIRSSLATDLPPVVADARSIRQIVLNLVSNSIKFTHPGGQVIVSTTLTEEGEVVMRVRDTGVGMTESDIAIAMEPFRQIATSGRAGSGGTGLGLPLTKALAEANRAAFNIRSAVDVGTIVEITFPSTRVLAE
ncbi:PAS domain-containing protein [Ancylobacter sp. TS-1]|uniref:PAS domain-containing sensor histidine kinase n=1 Tax=Ancylobacter sp. TS-1 TaxID=1850374 RepID=UPI001265B6BE|nr:PAS domain-containing protein [Ancylobacter sp. TS-1]QFR31642.1 PAS domain S-box protein [Ancylobacter sp. TS-1]